MGSSTFSAVWPTTDNLIYQTVPMIDHDISLLDMIYHAGSDRNIHTVIRNRTHQCGSPLHMTKAKNTTLFNISE